MNISTAWLGEWVQSGWNHQELASRLTMAGFEVEAVQPAAPPFEGVVVARILERKPHPDADKLSVCSVDDGSGQALQVVCGAANAATGMTVALARVGAKLPGGLVIKRARLRGVESAGMLCSARELGLSDLHEGILDLPGSLVPGVDLRDALELDDAILELSLTPNRGDAMSVAGIAREVAALSDRPLHMPPAEPVVAAIKDRLEVRLLEPAACPRFAGRVIRRVNPDAVTPLWMSERLRRAGLRPVSPVVDVTNYVMLELGQPMHAYDLRRVSGHIEVRLARPGERLVLLDGSDVELAADVLVIADAQSPVGIAGVMGGEKSGIAPDTTDVFLEVAYFAPAAIAGRARRYGMLTDASQRFERGVDPRLQERALERATRLLLDIVGGQPGPAVLTQVDAHLPRRPSVQLAPEQVARLLGVHIPRSEIEGILRSLGMQVAGVGDRLGVIPPSYRFDIASAEDLIEEVARIYGYEAIPVADADLPQLPGAASETFAARERVLTLLADRGYQEVITYSFVDPALESLVIPTGKPLALENPISAELAVMRRSLIPGLIATLNENSRRQQDRVRIFELGTRFLTDGGKLEERQSVAALAWGAAWPEQWGAASRPVDFFDLKGDLEALLALAGKTAGVRFHAGAGEGMHPGRCARIERDGLTLGWIGELHPEICKILELKKAPVIFEIDFEPSFKSQVPNSDSSFPFPVDPPGPRDRGSR